MGKWKKGVFNANYVLNQKGLFSQVKYECFSNPGRLEEVSVERYDNGAVCLVFTTHPDATNDQKQRGIHARLAYNSLFQDLNERFDDSHLTFSTSNDEVHRMCAEKGHERLLVQVFTRLEEYDNSASEIRRGILQALMPQPATVDEISQAITMQQERLRLLDEIKSQEQRSGHRRNSKMVITGKKRAGARKGRGRSGAVRRRA